MQITSQFRRALPGNVWILGFVSLLMDASSELVHGLLPLFLASVLGASMLTVGMLEGIAEATASVGKGIRGAPRDALIADITPAALRGAAFGLRQSLDSIGALAGPALAMALMAGLGGDIRAVFWFAALPALLARRRRRRSTCPAGSPTSWARSTRNASLTRASVVCGLVLLVAADLGLAAAATPAQVLAGAACWGGHMALTQGCSRN